MNEFDNYNNMEGSEPEVKKPAKKTSSKKDAVPGFLAGNPAAISRPGDGDDSYQLPPLSILASNPTSALSASSDDELAAVARKLQATLEEFGLTSRVTGWTAGPSVTTFKISPGEGERVSKITNLEDDIALSLAAKSVRIFAPIPGTSQVGIEIPNDARNSVYLADVLPYAQDGPLEAAFGRDSLYVRHLGIYAYRGGFLKRYIAEPPCELEKTEKLEQLRALWMGAKIAVVRTEDEGVGVDTPEDAVRVGRILEERAKR